MAAISAVYINKTGLRAICNKYVSLSKCQSFSTACVARAKQQEVQLDDEEFRVLVIPGHTKLGEKKQEARREAREIAPPRYKSMQPEQDWTNVWPSAQTFKWSVVPFPVRQGFIEKSENDGVVPAKYANAELMKIPNFLHLTPAHIKKHCAALKQFCNPWPRGLETDEACDKHFPIEVVTRDIVADSASIRDNRARVVTVKVKLSSLDLDYHARDKLIRLADKNYDASTDMLTLEVDRCPVKKQNYDFAMYLLTALYTESWKTEVWEDEKTLADMEKYFWDINRSRSILLTTLRALKQRSKEGSKQIPEFAASLSDDATDEQLVALPEVQQYKAAIEEIHNEEENLSSLARYKQAVKKMLVCSD